MTDPPKSIHDPPETLYATLDELQPVVDLAAYYEVSGPIHHRYRVPGQHFLLIAEGRIYAKTPQGDSEAGPGQMLCFAAADRNEYGYQGRVRYYEAHIQFAPPPRHRHSVWLDGIGPLPPVVALGADVAAMQHSFETFCIQLSQPGAAARAAVTAAVWEMLGVFAKVVRPDQSVAAHLDWWQRIRLRLGSHPHEHLEIQQLAREVGMSADHLIRGFRRRFGVSPGHYRSRELLRQAALRLRTGAEPIKTIAREFGFADSYSFTRAFRRYLGVLPSDLRAGRATTELADLPDEPLLPINRHVLPPNIGTDFYGKFQPKSD